MTEQEKVSALYKKLLSLYPQGFREEFGESMEQTFNDLYRERQRERGLFSFVFWTFAETTVGILQEHKQGEGIKDIFSHPTSAAIASLILSMPLGLTFVAFMFDIEPCQNISMIFLL